MKTSPTVGQILYSLNVGNAARHCKQILTPVKVVKVGRKYFTTQKLDDTSGWSATEYHLEDWCQKTEYAANSCLYVSEEQWNVENQQQQLIKQIKGLVERNALQHSSVEELQTVLSILTKD